MATKQLSRRHKAFTLVPLALLSGVWTASLSGVGGTATAVAHHGDVSLPDGTKVPSQAIQAPANVAVAGQIAPGVPSGTANSVVDSASTSGIPSAALSAYQRASQIINAADKSCNIPWQLIAAIGRVESDHGRYGGNVLSAKGVSTPGVYGIELNGKNGTAAIQDTDGGRLDKDPVYDRAVGPMQFIPSTWSVVQVDANGDGKRNPQDINDASLATGVYLCSGPENLGTRAGQEKSVFRYNHSQSYVDLVLRIMAAYQSGQYTAVPFGASGGTVFSPSNSTAMNLARSRAIQKQRAGHSGGGSSSGSGSSGSGTTPGGVTPPTGGGGSGGGTTPGHVPTTVPTTGVKPVIKVLTQAQALALCQTKLSRFNDPLGLINKNGGASRCASRVAGKTASAAEAAIPTSLAALVSWLAHG
ncbi:MAG: lytic transglycosylase domain-containing protein [Actinomycetota bacterium]|nr:lytic transglycosylase domain-containing protein [Actinomycetota bacterium]